jgi:uncharacterized protein DUF6603
MSEAVLVGRLSQALLDVLDPLRRALQNPAAFEALMRREGWQPPSTTDYFPIVADAFKLAGALETAASAIETLLDGGQTDATADLAAIEALVGVVNDLRAIAKPSQALPPPFDDPEFWSNFPADLIADLFTRYLEVAHPTIFAPLHLLGVLDEELVDPAGAPARLPFLRSKVEWSRLPRLVLDPTGLASEVYGWGTAAPLQHEKLLRRLERVLLAFGVPAGRFVPRASVSAIYYGSAPPPETVRELRVPLLEEARRDVGFVRVGVLALPIPPSASPGDAPVGLFVGPYTSGQAASRVELGGPLALELQGGLESGGDVGLELRPSDHRARAGTAGTDLDIAAALALEPNSPMVLVGSEDSDRITLGKARLQLGLKGPIADVELELTLDVDALTLVFDPQDGDSFVSEVFGTDPQTATAAGGLTWSSKTGLHVHGQAGLSLRIPMHVEFGPVTLQEVRFALEASDQAAAFLGTISAGAKVGPIQAAVEGIGVKLMLRPVSAPERGTFGDLDVSFEFEPPSGVGLAVDVAGLVGGGFIDHDPVAQQYAGMLQLAYQAYQLQAFGLIATRLPTGPGYSLLAMIDAEFPPIQLGYGFTLNGAGGLFGAHRTASIDALRAALKAHTLSNLLFPKDPVANAPQLLTELETVFPAADGRFIFGPLGRIGWGTPTLITFDLALVLELPSPVRLVLLGEVTAVLPRADHVVLEMHMDVLGTIDFGRGEGALDSALHDSRLLRFVLHGSSALRVTWVGSKTFILAVGGVHPKFQPPPGFPALERMGISMPSGSITKLNLDGYIALTSNTVQLGARVDLFVGVDGFGISGYLHFDTLIQMSPFHFDGDISGGVALSCGGEDLMSLRLQASLSGPTPWHVAGSVSFDVLWWTVTETFSATFGDPATEQTVDGFDVGKLLRDALADARNFSSPLPASETALVSLAKLPEGGTAGVVVAHPGAALSVHQRVVPLGLQITRFGAGVPQGETQFDIRQVAVDGSAPQLPKDVVDVLDEFAPAQFLTLTDDQELASPSFEQLKAGVHVAGSTTMYGAAATGVGALTRTLDYKTWFVDSASGQKRSDPSSKINRFSVDQLHLVLERGAAGRSALRHTAGARYLGPKRTLLRGAVQYVVATRDQLAASGVGAAQGQSYSQARSALASELVRHPERKGTLQVVARHEVS